jgi:hypothetical protein
VIDCGPDFDTAIVDLPAIGDPTPIECEQVNGEPAVEEPPALEPAPPSAPPVTVAPKPPKPKPDRTPPRTKLLRHPAAVLRVAPGRRALAVFRFGASERSHFECKLDRGPFHGCRSPLRLHLAPGRHTFRVYAIDAAGNRDRSPVLFHVRVVARRR